MMATTVPAAVAPFRRTRWEPLARLGLLIFINRWLTTFSKTTGNADGVLSADPDVFFSSVMTQVKWPWDKLYQRSADSIRPAFRALDVIDSGRAEQFE